jgi:hypothetical protein
VCQPALTVGPSPEVGLFTLAWRPQSLPEEVIHNQLPLLDDPERNMPSVPGFCFQRISSARV